MVRAENAEKEENAKADTFVNHGSLCMITTTSANFIRSKMENPKERPARPIIARTLLTGEALSFAVPVFTSVQSIRHVFEMA